VVLVLVLGLVMLLLLVLLVLLLVLAVLLSPAAVSVHRAAHAFASAICFGHPSLRCGSPLLEPGASIRNNESR